MAERIMPREDAEVSAAVTTQFEKDGITVLTEHSLRRFFVEHGQKKLKCRVTARPGARIRSSPGRSREKAEHRKFRSGRVGCGSEAIRHN